MNRCIEYGGPSGVEILTFDHLSIGSPVYKSYEGDLWVMQYPDGTLREVVPMAHHMSDKTVADLDEATKRLMKLAQEPAK